MRTETEQAIDVIARRVVHLLLTAPVGGSEDIALWEDYPEIGEHDWDRVIDRAKVLAPPNPDADEYTAAYAHLSARVDAEYEGEATL